MPPYAEWPPASWKMADKGGSETMQGQFLSLPGDMLRHQQDLEEKHKLNRQLRSKDRQHNIWSMKNPSSLKSQKAENNRAKLCRSQCDVQQDNKLVVGCSSNREISKPCARKILGLCETMNNKKSEETQGCHTDVHEETRPKQMYGGDEHDEEEKLRRDLLETEKGQGSEEPQPMEPRASVHVGREGHSHAQVMKMLTKLSEPRKILQSEEVTRAVLASVLYQLNNVFHSKTGRMNAMNKIMTCWSSVQEKIAIQDVEGEIADKLPRCATEDKSIGTEVHVIEPSVESQPEESMNLRAEKHEQPVKGEIRECEQPGKGQSRECEQPMEEESKEREQPKEGESRECEQPMKGEGTDRGKAVPMVKEPEQPVNISAEDCEQSVKGNSTCCENLVKGEGTDYEKPIRGEGVDCNQRVTKISEPEQPVRVSTEAFDQSVNGNQSPPRNETLGITSKKKKATSRRGKCCEVFSVIRRRDVPPGKKFVNEPEQIYKKKTKRNNRGTRQSPRVMLVKTGALLDGTPLGQNSHQRAAVKKASGAIHVKKQRYVSLGSQPFAARCCSQGNSSGGMGTTGFQGNSGSDGTSGSPNSPQKDSHGEKGSERGEGERNGDDDKGDGNDRNLRNSNSPVVEVTSDPVPGATSPDPNFKWFRKKPDEDRGHGDLKQDIPEVLGLLSNGIPGLHDCDEEFVETLLQVDRCLVRCLISVENGHGQDNLEECLVCTIIQSLFRHVVRDKTATLKECMTCCQLFEMMKFHLQGCCVKPSLGSECSHSLALCRRLHRQGLQYADRPQAWEKFLWDALKELMTRLFDDVELLTLTPAAGSGSSISQKRSLRRKVSAKATLKIIPEDEDAGRQLRQQQQASFQSFETRSEHSQSLTTHQTISVSSQSDTEVSHTDALIRNLSDQPQPLPPRQSLETFGSVRAYTNYGCVSLPTEHAPRTLYAQLLSFEERPTGEPGIGEVIYGSVARLRSIAEHWTHVKKMWWTGEKFPRVSREEGVILPEYRDQLQIGKTRYQEDVQWQKISQLGRGVSGRCYLARDFNTECHFCIKEILITSYQEDELLIWSTLVHRNIVQLYGAIRADSHIYILAEFIDGGCLTEHINNQRELNRRLSKAVALRYFKQLLEVLIYLQRNNVLHEDLKADNILLRTSPPEPEIVVADFGLARKVQPGERVGKTSPVGAQTQWSPEKAASLGYDFKSDVWAATCVLAHIFNGQPPWVQQFGHAAVLHYVIMENSPPLGDMPRNVTEDIQKVIQLGWTLDVDSRPYAHELLEAIKLECHPTGENLFSAVNSIVPGFVSGEQPQRSSLSDDQGSGQGVSPVSHTSEGQTKVGGTGEPAHGTRYTQVTVTTEIQVTTVSRSATADTNPAEANSSVPSQSSENPLGTGSWNNSDPHHHILQYMQDEGDTGVAEAYLPKLPVFEESISGERLDSEEEDSMSGDRQRIKPRSASSPNISVFPLDDQADTVFNSSDLFGSGSQPIDGLSVENTLTQQLPPCEPEPVRPHATHQHSNPLNLHLDVGKASVNKPHKPHKLLTSMSTSALDVKNTCGAAGGKSCSADVSAGIFAITHNSPYSVNTSGSSPRSQDSQSTTPRSSTYDTQDKEMLSLTKDMFKEMMREPHSHPTDIMELAQSLCSDNQEDDADETALPAEPSLEEMQASMRHHPHTSSDARDGSLIKFVNQSQQLMAQVRIRDVNTEWRDVIVDIVSPTIHASEEFKRFFVQHEDGSIVDMSAPVGRSDVTVTVVPLDDSENPQSWFIQDHKFHWD